MEIKEVLVKIQTELKAPKSQVNNFGHYNYRNCEDILEALKPFLKETNSTLVISDEIVLIGARYYVKATATLMNGSEQISATAYAREEEDRKGMDRSQITGATSSYARKYALNGLFAIDDTKDADSGKLEEKSAPIKQESSSSPKIEDMSALKDTINVEQAKSATKDSTIQAIMGLLQAWKERQVKAKDVLKDITDYTLTSMDGNHKIMVSTWAKAHEGIHQGQVVTMKDVRVGMWKDALTYTAKDMEVVGQDTIKTEPPLEEPF